jgi:serine/threonine protein kinase
MLCKEALLWRQLSHPHILPFLGIDTETFASRNALCLVSPWMQNGTLKQYITSPSYNVDDDQSRLVILLRLTSLCTCTHAHTSFVMRRKGSFTCITRALCMVTLTG